MEKTTQNWYEEADSWIANDGPLDLEGIKEELSTIEEIDDVNEYARTLKEYIDEILDEKR